MSIEKNKGLSIAEALKILRTNQTHVIDEDRSQTSFKNAKNVKDSSGASITDVKWYICFDHSSPDFTRICTADVARDLGGSISNSAYVYAIDKIQPGKKSLIANNDESAWEVVSNVDSAEWLAILKDAYKACIKDIAEYGECDNAGPCGLYFAAGDIGTDSEQAFIDRYNDFIDQSSVDNDSSAQYCWYSAEDLAQDATDFYL